jgi:IgA-specific serine endopeptidase
VQRLTHRTLELLRELEDANARTSQAQDASVLLTDELSAARGEGAVLVKKLAAAERAAAAAQGEAAAAARECAALRKQSDAAQERAAEFKAVAVAAEESGAALEARAEAAERDAAAQRTAALETAREAELLRLRVAALEASRPDSPAAASASSSTAVDSETPRVLRRVPSSGAHEGGSHASPTHSQSPRKSPGRGGTRSTGALAVSRAAPAPAREMLVELAALERRAEGAEDRANKVSAAQPCCALARAPCYALTAGGWRWGRSVRARRRWRRPRSCWARSCRRWRTRRARRASGGRSSCGGSPRWRTRFAGSSLLTNLGTTVGRPHLSSRQSCFVMQRS